MYDVAAVRAHIPALAFDTAFFDGPGGSQTPTAVAAAIAGALTAPLANRGQVTAAARNAEALVRMGAAVRIPDRECTGRRLALELDALLADPERLHAMREAARENGHPDAAARVAELVDAHAR